MHTRPSATQRLPLLLLLLALLHLVASAPLPNTFSNGGEKIAVMTNGDITDFGWSNTVNTGRVNMERTLNVSGSYFAMNVLDQPAALALMRQLVAEGYVLIISATSAHGNAAAVAAKQFPNVSFVQTGGTSAPPNLSSLNWNGPDMYYIAGTFCGAMTKTGSVGFIHPGAPLASYATLNAFYVGAKTASPSVQVFAIFTDSYLNPDRTAGAADILLNSAGVGMIAGQQDDFTVQTKAMAAGLLAVGINGFSLRDIFGEGVGVSIVRNWGGPFSIYAKGALASTFRKDISASFASNYTYLDTPSYQVPPDVWAIVVNGTQLVRQPVKPYYCSEWVTELGLNPATGCLSNTTKFPLAPLSGIHNLGHYAVPLTEKPFPRTTSLAITVISAFLLILPLTIAGGLFYLRRDQVMLAASPFFLGLVLVGCSIVYIGTIAWGTKASVSICSARIWLPSIGATLTIGVMMIKNVRLWIIFDAQLRKVKIRDTKLLAWTSALLAADVILLALWTGLGEPRGDRMIGEQGLGTYQYRIICRTDLIGDRILYAIIGFHIAQLLVGCYVTFKIRVITIEEFNEARPFGLCIYIVSLCFIIAGILIGTTTSTVEQTVIIVSFTLLIGTTAVLFMLFVPKFLAIATEGTRPIERLVASFRARAKNNSSSTEPTSASATSTAPSTPVQSNKPKVLVESV